MRATLSSAEDMSVATVSSDFCIALRSFAMDRREWPKLLHYHLIKILECRVMERGATGKDRRRYQSRRRYYERYWKIREERKQFREENRENVLELVGMNGDGRRARAKEEATRGDWEPFAKFMLQDAESRARKKNLPFDLTLEWVVGEIGKGSCPYMKLPYWPYDYYRPSIDRIDSILGYTMDNCQVTSWAYNTLKWSLPNDIAQVKIQQLVETLCRHHVTEIQ